MRNDELAQWARAGGFETEHLEALGDAVGRALALADDDAQRRLAVALREARRVVARDPVRKATVAALSGVLLAADGALRRAAELAQGKTLSPSCCALLRALESDLSTPAELAQRLKCDKAQVSRDLAQLVERKLVDRYAHTDGRTFLCGLSPRGRQVLPHLPPAEPKPTSARPHRPQRATTSLAPRAAGASARCETGPA